MKITNNQWQLNLIAGGTVLLGVVTLSSTLFSLVHLHRARLVIADAHLTVIAGISLIYLASLLRRAKRNAWLVSLPIFALLLIRNLRHFVFGDDHLTRHYLLIALSNLVLPALLLIGLLVFRKIYLVKSEPTTFKIAFRRALIILAIAFLYGFVGFQLFDQHDFHQEISAPQAAHYTVDQLGLTTNNQPGTHTRRSLLFVDSLASVSVASLVYVGLAFFAPVRFRLYTHKRDYDLAQSLVKKNAKTSEDFFKLWPTDKAYMFSSDRSAMLAYKVKAGVALVVGDPIGPLAATSQLFADFCQICHVNDWSPAFIHSDKSSLKLYKAAGLEAQKIGEEALVNIANFQAGVSNNKYFRNIKNRFNKQGFSFEVLKPPHAAELLNNLEKVSNDWLDGPGREERGFMLGYFDSSYLNLCDLAIVRDPEGKVLAFLNQLPTLKAGEANFDFLRSGREGPGNINDFLMVSFIDYLAGQGYKWVNMGLSPLAGLGDQLDKSFVDNVFGFVYQNAGRFYSFQGLARFKSKYEPEWQDRYIVYTGGLAGFGRTLSALLRAMTIKKVRPRASRR